MCYRCAQRTSPLRYRYYLLVLLALGEGGGGVETERSQTESLLMQLDREDFEYV